MVSRGNSGEHDSSKMAGVVEWGWSLIPSLILFATLQASADVVIQSGGYASYTQTLASTQVNQFQVQFRTKDQTGLLLHAKGGTDFVTLELVKGRLRYAADFGMKYDSYGEAVSGFHELFVGQMLGDSEWHNVVLTHNEEKHRISIKVDNLKEVEFEAYRTIPQRDVKLSLEYVHTGGMKFIERISHKESLAGKGISGCIRNTTYNGRSVIDGDHVTLIDAKNEACPLKSFTNLIDFPVNSSYLSYNYTGKQLLLSFAFRTNVRNQLLFETGSGSLHDLKIRTDTNGRVMAQSGNTNLSSEVTGTHSGIWHDVELSWSSSSPFTMVLKVDGKVSSMVMKQGFPSIVAVEKFFFGKEFQGCMANIEVNGKTISQVQFDKYGPSAKWEPTFGSCAQTEFCIPNPCLNGGKCKGVYGLKEFPRGTYECDCANTGYNGSACNKPLYRRSCAEIKATSKNSVSGKMFIDVDGLGPLPKIEVECLFGPMGVSTVVDTMLSGDIAVENPFGKKQIKIPYSADKRSIRTITTESKECQQHVKYVCTKSALFQSPSGPPQVRWLGPDYYFHYYWGGSNGKTDHCMCGLYNNCTDKSKYCNCDARSGTESKDEGTLVNKKHLPMQMIEFLDVSSWHGSKGRFSIGNLKCSGDATKDKAVSFRDAMAFIKIKPTSTTDYNNAIDAMSVSFIFKTTDPEGVIFYGKGRTSADYIMIKIQSRSRIRAEINLGSKADFVDINIKGQFDDDNSHTVSMEFNRKELSLTVDSYSSSSQRDPTSMSHLDLEGEPMTLGGGDGIAGGFTGCIQRLFINGLLVDIQSSARDMMNYGVYLGCGIGCNRPSIMPCNYGKCIEKYTTFSCDCSLSPFDGKYCHKESYPVKFIKDSSIMYTFRKPEEIKEGFVVVAFKTIEENGLIFSIHGDKPNRHLSLVMIKGSLKVAYNFQTASVTSKFIDVETASRKYRFDDGKLYSVKISHNAKRVSVQMLDGRSPEVVKTLDSTNDLLTGVKISIGSVRSPLSTQPGLPNDFIGCMSSFKYKFLPNMAEKQVLVDVFALFGTGSKDVGGKGELSPCGKSLPTPPPLPVLIGRPMVTTKYVKPVPRLEKTTGVDYSWLIVGIACAMAVILMVVILILCKHINRNLGAYRTYEDKRPLCGQNETSFAARAGTAAGENNDDDLSEEKPRKKPEVFV